MATLPIDYTFSNGDVANANHVNTNFQSIKTFVEASLVSTDGAVQAGTAAIANNAVTTAKILDSNVTTGKIANDAVTAEKIAAGAVGASEIADGSVGTAELANGAVTAAKKSGFSGVTYQDFTITGVINDADAFFQGSDHVITFGGGKTYNDVVSIVPNAGTNSTVTLYHYELGAQGGVLNNNQARLNCSISNNIDTGGNVNVRVWFFV
jgi:hypothetical protein